MSTTDGEMREIARREYLERTTDTPSTLQIESLTVYDTNGQPYKLADACFDVEGVKRLVAENDQLHEQLAREIAARNGWWDKCKEAEAEIERWRDSNIRLRSEMEHQSLRANIAEAELAAAREALAALVESGDCLLMDHRYDQEYRDWDSAKEKHRAAIDAAKKGQV